MVFDPLVGEARVQGVLELVPTHWWVGLVLGLMPVHWCSGPGHGLSGGQGLDLGWLQAQRVIREQACQYVALCLCLASCLALGVPVLVQIG